MTDVANRRNGVLDAGADVLQAVAAGLTGKPTPHGALRPGLLFPPPTSSSFGGRFGRMFRNLPVFEQDPAALHQLAQRMISDVEDDPTPVGQVDPEENDSIPAGYTYLGQFIDHDITFDPTSSLQRQNDPDALETFRTPRYDLDNLYGRGPDDEPFLYEQNGQKLQLGNLVDASGAFAGPDLQRNVNGRALVGDPRNDENLVISQLQVTFCKFHNRLVDHVGATTQLTGADLLKEAQRQARWHYQWVVLHDFLPRIVGPGIVDDILRPITAHPGKRNGPALHFFRWNEQPFIPVEFSVAAYRFGHSMVRPDYFFNDFVRGATGGKRTAIFSTDPNPLSNLNGFRPLPPKWGFQWQFFFENIDTSATEARVHPQLSYKIDSHLVNPLGQLPFITDGTPSLAERNLLRGLRFSLPSGQTVALAMGLDPLTNEQLGIDDIPGLSGHAPLWYYILKEAELQANGAHLGAVGGRIVAEVLVGLAWGDPLSYLRVEPRFRPAPPLAQADNTFGMPELIRFALSS